MRLHRSTVYRMCLTVFSRRLGRSVGERVSRYLMFILVDDVARPLRPDVLDHHPMSFQYPYHGADPRNVLDRAFLEPADGLRLFVRLGGNRQATRTFQILIEPSSNFFETRTIFLAQARPVAKLASCLENTHPSARTFVLCVHDEAHEPGCLSLRHSSISPPAGRGSAGSARRGGARRGSAFPRVACW